MFPVAYALEFNEAHTNVTRHLFFLYDDYEALGLFNDALQRALVNVRAFPEAYPRIRRRADRAARYPLRPFGAGCALVERMIERSVPSRLCSRRNTA